MTECTPEPIPFAQSLKVAAGASNELRAALVHIQTAAAAATACRGAIFKCLLHGWQGSNKYENIYRVRGMQDGDGRQRYMLHA